MACHCKKWGIPSQNALGQDCLEIGLFSTLTYLNPY